MKQVISSACLAAAFAVGLSAQTPSPTTPQTPSPSPQTPTTSPQTPSPMSPGAQASPTGKTVSLTGCLKAGDTPGSFALSNVKMPDAMDKASDAAGAMGATGTSGTAAKSAMGNATVKLTGSPSGVTMADHVGHTVKVTGTMSGAAPSGAMGSAGAMATNPSGAASTAADAAGKSATLDVTAVSMVSGSCSQ